MIVLPIIVEIFSIYLYNFIFLGVSLDLFTILSFSFVILIFLCSYLSLILFLTIIPKKTIYGFLLPFATYIISIIPIFATFYSPYYYFLIYKGIEFCLNSNQFNLIAIAPIILFVLGLICLFVLFFRINRFNENELNS